jgi:hypothetical protein
LDVPWILRLRELTLAAFSRLSSTFLVILPFSSQFETVWITNGALWNLHVPCSSMHSLQAVIDNATGTSSGMGDPLSIQEPDRAEPRAQRNPLRRTE